MPSRRVIPSLLLRAGRLVKGVSFADWRDVGLPATTVRAYNAQKADEILMVDIDAGREDRSPDVAAMASVAQECQVPLTFGGNIRSIEDAQACLNAGADKVFVNTTALDRPQLIRDLANAFGAQAIVLGVDVIHDGGDWLIYDYRTGNPVPDLPWREWIKHAADLGAGEIRLMAVDREGRRCGMDTALYNTATGLVDRPVILEGGAGNLADIEAAMSAGVEAIAIGTMLVFSDNNIIQVKRHLKNAGFPIRI